MIKKIIVSSVAYFAAFQVSAGDFFMDVSAGVSTMSDIQVQGGVTTIGSKTTTGSFEVDPGYALNFDLGWHVGERFALGFETGFAQNSVEGGETATSVPFMAIAEYQHTFGEKWLASLGAGLGGNVVILDMTNVASGLIRTRYGAVGFQWQLRSGLGYKLSENISAGIDYRYSQLIAPTAISGFTLDSLASHFIGASINFRF